MYKYYAEQESEDHYLFSKEIADLLYKNYGIANEKGRPATKLVEALLNSIEEEPSHSRDFSHELGDGLNHFRNKTNRIPARESFS